MLPQLPPKISLAQLPTPLRPLDRISTELNGPRIWLKSDDLTGSLLSGNKVRKLEFVLAEAQQQGADVVVTCGGIQSNHCRATAVAAAQLGMHAHLILRNDKENKSPEADKKTSDAPVSQLDGNILLDHLCGATVSLYPPVVYQSSLDKIFEETRLLYTKTERVPYLIPTGASDEVGLWGYISAAGELHSDFARLSMSPDAVICATGSAGTQGGLTLGFYLLGSTVSVCGYAVCESEKYFHDKVLQDIYRWQQKYSECLDDGFTLDGLKINTNDKYIGPGYARGYEAMYRTLKWLARREGVVLDPVYTGKAFHGLVSDIKKGLYDHCSNIVFVHTGGIFGLFPFKKELNIR